MGDFKASEGKQVVGEEYKSYERKEVDHEKKLELILFECKYLPKKKEEVYAIGEKAIDKLGGVKVVRSSFHPYNQNGAIGLCFILQLNRSFFHIDQYDNCRSVSFEISTCSDNPNFEEVEKFLTEIYKPKIIYKREEIKRMLYVEGKEPIECISKSLKIL
jgi:S-adenosylmethionine/arginine decarboxylase-like enzyme